jgi:RNA polymerase sigma-70 factor, ECF subfamily
MSDHSQALPPEAVADSISDSVVAAAGRGDPDAFAVIWRELSPAVSGYLSLRGVRDPEAVTSDVFIAVLPRLAGLRGGGAGLRTFVFSVAHARAVDEARRRARRPDAVEFDQLLHDTVDESAESMALRRVADREVREMLDRLPADHRDVLLLRVVADLGLEQTAAVMNRSVGAVKQLQRRALLTLRAEVAAGRVTPDALDSLGERP